MCALDLHEQIEALMDIEAYDEVVLRLDKEGALDRDDFLLNWNLGWAYFKLNQFARAAPPLERAVEIEPHQFAAQFAYGLALESLGRLKQAEAALRTALVLRDSGMARQALAVVLMGKKEFAAAERIHLDGLEVSPDSASRWQGYADFLFDTGRLQEADTARAKAVKFAAQNSEEED